MRTNPPSKHARAIMLIVGAAKRAEPELRRLLGLIAENRAHLGDSREQIAARLRDLATAVDNVIAQLTGEAKPVRRQRVERD